MKIRWQRFFSLKMIFVPILILFAGAGYAQELEVITVPWVPGNPGIPHDTYNGVQTTFMAIARGGTGSYTFEWDFDGDGTYDYSNTTSNPYNLSATHTYPIQLSDRLFIARIRVSSGSETETAEYRVMIHEPASMDTKINRAIDNGLWYLHTEMIRGTYGGGAPGYSQPFGYWTDTRFNYHLGATGTSVDAFQLHGSKANGDFDNDPYVETVQRALNYLLYHTYAFQIGPQPAGDPDTNGNGIGLVMNHSANLYDSRQTYIGGICMTAFASSGSPNRVANVGGPNVVGRTYADIVQDMVDFFSWGQVDSGSGRGGWRYYANYSGSDMSTTQWPPLGMMAAEENMGSSVPQFVRDELILFLDYTQHEGCDTNNGGFGYSVDINIPNCTKAAAGIICHEFLGTSLTDPKVQSAIGFLYRHWNDAGNSWNYQRLLGNSYGMYGVMKAMRLPEPDIAIIGDFDCSTGTQTAISFDWYYAPNTEPREGLAHYLVRTQFSDGSWDDVSGLNAVWDAFSTGWRVLILLKGVTIIPPAADICDCDEQEYNLGQDIHLDAACSLHPDKNRSIVSYAWDLDNDGEYDDAIGETATIAGGFADEGYYPVSVRVTDDNPDNLGGPQTSIYTCEIYVHPPPHCPHAFADGPYIGWINEAVIFDAFNSWDPDNEIVKYEWDLDNDGLFGEEDSDCFGKPADAVGISPEWTWDAPYTGAIGLRVTDAASEVNGVPIEPCSDIDYTTIEIGNHAPVSDPSGPYQTTPSYTVNLDGSGSHDPDPGDTITCAWDLDNDGEFDDANGCEAEMWVPADALIGNVYDICLKVTDSFGETDTECTTITVVPNQPPNAVCEDVTVSADESCMAGADVDAGSFDPDGDPLDIQQEPAGPYALGDTEVTLTVTDPLGLTGTCTATVTVVDDTAPTVLADIVSVPGGGGDDDGDDDGGLARVEYAVTDNCDAEPTVKAYIRVCRINIPVESGQLISAEGDDDCEYEWENGILEIEAKKFHLIVKTKDETGNVEKVKKTFKPKGDD